MSGPQCCENPPTLNSSSGRGHVQDFGGLSSYISGPSDSKAAVVLISDIFGYDAPKLRKLADKVGAAGFYTVVPDFLHGDPFVPEQKPLSDWINDHGTDQEFENAKPVIEALKSKGITKIGAAGFCWGELVKQFEAALNAKPEIDCFVKIFPGVSHGWTVRYEDENEEEVKCAQEAHQYLLDWFVNYLN